MRAWAWWHDKAVLAALGPALGELFEAEEPTVVLGVQSSGYLPDGLTAIAWGVGFVGVREDVKPLAHSDTWLQRTTPRLPAACPARPPASSSPTG